MASLEDVWTKIRQELESALANQVVETGSGPLSAPFKVFKDNPTPEMIRDLAQKATPLGLISIFDAMNSRDATRWIGQPSVDSMNACQIFAEVSNEFISPISGAIIWITGTAVAGDALVALFGRGSQRSITIRPAEGAVAASIAASLTNAINADPIISTWLSATNEANRVVLRTQSLAANRVAVATSNTALRTYYAQQVERGTQITLWTSTHQMRKLGAEVISSLVAQWQHGNGFYLADGSWARIRYRGDKYLPNKTNDVFQWILHVDAEFGITYTEPVYPILAIINESIPLSGSAQIESGTGVTVHLPPAPFNSTAYGVLLAGSWNTVYYAPLSTAMAFLAFGGTQPIIPGGTIYYSVIPRKYPGFFILPISEGQPNVVIPRDQNNSTGMVLCTPNWNTTTWIDSLDDGHVTVAFQTPAPQNGSLAVLFPEENSSFKQLMDLHQTAAFCPLPLNNGQLAFAMPSWNTKVSLLVEDKQTTAFFSCAAPSGSFVHWGYVPSN